MMSAGFLFKTFLKSVTSYFTERVVFDVAFSIIISASIIFVIVVAGPAVPSVVVVIIIVIELLSFAVRIFMLFNVEDLTVLREPFVIAR